MTNPWQARLDLDREFLGDGSPSMDGDTRVRCWFCAHYTHHLQVPIYQSGSNGEQIKEWINCRTCAKGLGHDPFILRRCEAFKALSPRLRMKLPPEAFQAGWRDDYGTEEYQKGRKNRVDPPA